MIHEPWCKQLTSSCTCGEPKKTTCTCNRCTRSGLDLVEKQPIPVTKIHCTKGIHCFHGQPTCDCGQEKYGIAEEWETELKRIMGEKLYEGVRTDFTYENIREIIMNLLSAQRKKVVECVPEWKPAHTYASENAGIYSAYDKGFQDAIREMKENIKKLGHG